MFIVKIVLNLTMLGRPMVIKERLIIWASPKVFPSARKLKDLLKAKGIKRVLLLGNKIKKYKHKPTDVVINWGNGQYASWNTNIKMINTPYTVAKAVNKLNAFKAFQAAGVATPEWTTDVDVVEKEWLAKNHTVVARTKLNGFGGEGIVIFDQNISSIPVAPLYVKYKKKRHEYRVHVFNGNVIDVSWKRKRKEFDNANYQVRNYHNGWVYCRENITITNELQELAKAAINALGLKFGAVDIIWNEKENKYYVLEVNTAPGLVGTTLEAYVTAILGDYNESA